MFGFCAWRGCDKRVGDWRNATWVLGKSSFWRSRNYVFVSIQLKLSCGLVKELLDWRLGDLGAGSALFGRAAWREFVHVGHPRFRYIRQFLEGGLEGGFTRFGRVVLRDYAVVGRWKLDGGVLRQPVRLYRFVYSSLAVTTIVVKIGVRAGIRS